MKIFLLIGYGVSNKNVYAFLKKRRKKILVYDDSNKFLSGNIPRITNIYTINFQEIRCAIISPGIKPQHYIIKYLKEKNISIMTDMDLLYQYHKNKGIPSYYVGLTGTNGKTTTVQLISELIGIPHILCGNIGSSIFQKTRKINGVYVYIMEVSSYQLHYMAHMRFNLGIIINIEENHNEWHGGFIPYKEAKEKIKYISDRFLNLQDGSIHTLEKNCSKIGTVWKIHDNKLYYNNHIVLSIHNSIFLLEHNILNLLNSLVIITILYEELYLCINRVAIKNINTFTLSPHRQQIIYNSDHTIIVNDSKSTNIASTKVAIENYKNKGLLLLFLGGVMKGDLALLTPLLQFIHHIIIFGANRELLECYMKNNQYTNFSGYPTLKQATEDIKDVLYNNKIIIFSPGGASFDEFANYMERGLFFTKNILLKLEQE